MIVYHDEPPTRAELDDERRPRGYCVRCRSWVTARVRDESFAYSYGSINAVHRQESIECPVCEGPLLKTKPIEYPTEGD